MALNQQRDSPPTLVRFLLDIPSEQPYEIWIDGKRLHKKWYHQDLTPFFKLSSGLHLLEVKASDSGLLRFSRQLNIKPAAIFTYLLSRHPKDLANDHLFPIEEPRRHIASPHAFIRIAHFSIVCPALSVGIETDHCLFKNVRYAQLTRYMPLIPSRYPLYFSDSETHDLIHQLKTSPFKIGRLYTLYTLGDSTQQSPFDTIRVIDGPSFLNA